MIALSIYEIREGFSDKINNVAIATLGVFHAKDWF